jgi:membrane protease YdiL (CAAX protease family)
MEASRGAAEGAVVHPKGDIPGGERGIVRPFTLVAVGVLTIWTAHNALLLPWEVRNIDDGVREPLLVLVRAMVWMLPVVFYLRRYDPRPRLVALGVTSPINRRGLAWSALGALVYLSLVTLLVTSNAPPRDTPSPFATLAQITVLSSMLACVLEELLMRGFLLGQLVRFTTSFRAQATVAVLFGLVHLPGWIALDGVSINLLPSTIMIMLLGAVLGGITRASNSILPAIVVHCANNFLGDWLGGG